MLYLSRSTPIPSKANVTNFAAFKVVCSRVRVHAPNTLVQMQQWCYSTHKTASDFGHQASYDCSELEAYLRPNAAFGQSSNRCIFSSSA